MVDENVLPFARPESRGEAYREPFEPRREPLANLRLEQSLLGALLTKPSLLEFLPASFSAEHYHDPLHEEIHRTLVEVGQPGTPAAVLVGEALAMRDPRGREYLAGLLVAAVGYQPSLITQYADGITQLYRKRSLSDLSYGLRDMLHAPATDLSADAAIAMALSWLEELTAGAGVSGRASVTLDDAMDKALRKADEAHARGGPAGLSTGFSTIDDKLGGMDEGDLIVLAGRPGSGKSALAMQIALAVARRGIGVLVISQEMMADALGRRALCAAAGVPLWALKRGRHEPYVEQLMAARRELNGLPLSIEDGGGISAASMGLKARAAKRRFGAHGLGLIVVDHLHITPPEGHDAKHGPTHAVGAVSGALKRLAKAMSVPVLALAQLNRGVENRDDKRPGLPDLRQSGSIEQDADAVAFLYRAEMYMLNEPLRAPSESTDKFNTRLNDFLAVKARAAGKAELIIPKVRDGETGTVALAFHGETTSFAEIAQ